MKIVVSISILFFSQFFYVLYNKSLEFDHLYYVCRVVGTLKVRWFSLEILVLIY